MCESKDMHMITEKIFIEMITKIPLGRQYWVITGRDDHAGDLHACRSSNVTNIAHIRCATPYVICVAEGKVISFK